jgi:hypothetical protein
MRYTLFIPLLMFIVSCNQHTDSINSDTGSTDTIPLSYELTTSCLDSLILIGEFLGEQIFEGGFSGMTHIPNTENEFFVVTDRGPNTSLKRTLGKEGAMLFPFPDYTQKIIRLKYANSTFQVVSIHPILGPDGENISGFPAKREDQSNTESPSIDLKGTKPTDRKWKFDLEAIAIDNNGDLWLADEYRPAILQVDGTSFQIKKIFSTEKEDDFEVSPIPKIFSLRQANRGFEGIAVTPSGKVLAILQSPLATPELSDSLPNRLLRILHLDPNTGVTKTFGYELTNQMIDPKIGDMVAINEHEFLVIEHGKDSLGKVAHVFKIDLEYATNIDEIHFNMGTSFEGLKNNSKAQYRGIILAQKSHVVDLIQVGFNPEFGKPEGIAILDDSTIVLVNDNDFGIEIIDDKGKLILNNQPSCIYQIRFNKPIF